MRFPHRTKRWVAAWAALCLYVCSASSAGSVPAERARKVAAAFVQTRAVRLAKESKSLVPTAKTKATLEAATPAGLREIRDDDGTVLAFVADLWPRGFVALSADTDMAPVIAYSFRNAFPGDTDQTAPLYRMLKADMRLRARALALAEREYSGTVANNAQWTLYADGVAAAEGGTFQQWPAENTTSTGGLVETMWHQDTPYNVFCPLDPVDGIRSYVGCTATALAQVVNYHRQCDMAFSAADAYTTYSGIRFDADSTLYDFPSFAELNTHLAAVQSKYSRAVDLNDVDVAAISFACGVLTHMDYSSEGSGASMFSLQETLLDEFGFASADMTGGISGEYAHVLRENLVNGLPAIMAISSPDGWGGHVVICDGFNTDGEYHLNFGWGAAAPERMTDVWYRLPSDLPPRLSIVVETVLNIQPVRPAIEVDSASLTFYAVPGQPSAPQILRIDSRGEGATIHSVSSPAGFRVARADGAYADHLDAFEIPPGEQSVWLNVKYCPDEPGSGYGILAIHYGDGALRHVILKGYAFSGGTDVQAGEVSGTWSQAESPYFVAGDIHVPEQGQLVIEPGVKVLFVGPYGLTVGRDARLLAVGQENRPIEFTAWNRSVGWTGLRFVESRGDDVLTHCWITYAMKTAGVMTRDEIDDADSCGGAVYCYASSPTLTYCKITNNTGDKGGALYCLESSPVISNTLIANNASLGGDPRCGGICSESWGFPEIQNCTLANNTPGGIFTTSWQGMDVTNTILWGNESYQIQTMESVPTVSFCDVQGGYPGAGNMEADPCFFAPSFGVGVDHDGAAANWTLKSDSPCINAGIAVDLPAADLAGAQRVFSGVVDVGAYENQSELPLMTVGPSTPVDAGCVAVDANSVTGLDITNTGQVDLRITSVSVSDRHDVFSVVTPVADRVLAPGDSVSVAIQFTPILETVYTGILRVESTSSNAPHKEVALRGVGVSGTTVAGAVQGTWTRDNSPYTVTGDIHVPRGRTLTIEPGVVVTFAGHFRFTVGYRATLDASGTEDEPILFTPTDTETGWFGIRFINSGADDVLEYCTVEYARKSFTGGGNYPDLAGGGILCCGSWEKEPGFPVPSSPRIAHCRIAHNHAESGGGILCTDDSKAVITNNTIVDNTADIDGAGIEMLFAYGTIANNVIAHNSAMVGGGILNYWSRPSITNNTIVHNRPSALHLESAGVLFWTKVLVSNNIIWQNEIYLSPDAGADAYDIRFNGVQGGWIGTGNIDVDPCFADPEYRDYHLKSRAGRWGPRNTGWVSDETTSPCIDAGDPQTAIGDEPVPHGERINMGAHGGTAHASKSP